MSLLFIPEHANHARFALELALKEMGHLQFTHQGLFANKPDLFWVASLSDHPLDAERLDAFVSRFSRLQDHLGEKLLPRFAQLVGASPRSLIDALNTAERMNWLSSAQAFVAARKLRNLMVHEYMSDPRVFLDATWAADDACYMLYDTVRKVQLWSESNELIKPRPLADF